MEEKLLSFIKELFDTKFEYLKGEISMMHSTLKEHIVQVNDVTQRVRSLEENRERLSNDLNVAGENLGHIMDDYHKVHERIESLELRKLECEKKTCAKIEDLEIKVKSVEEGTKWSRLIEAHPWGTLMIVVGLILVVALKLFPDAVHWIVENMKH
jgi:hypothetical protein